MAKKKLTTEPIPTKVHPMFQNMVCYSLSKTGVLFRMLLERSLTDYGLIPPQAGILHILSGYGEFNQILLGQEMSIDKASMVKFIDGLESKGMVQRKGDPHDRRAKLVTLTEKGKRVQKEISKIHRKLEADILKDFTREEVEAIRTLMPRVLGAVLDKINKKDS